MKKPTLKELQTQLTEAQATIVALQHKLVLAEADASGLKKSTVEHEATAKAATEKLAVARKALAPFLAKTAHWDWPDDNIGAVLPLTFGDLRAARDAAASLQ